MPPSFIKVVLAMLLAGDCRALTARALRLRARNEGNCGPSGLALVHLACGPLRRPGTQNCSTPRPSATRIDGRK